MVPGVTGEMTTGEYHPREVRGESTASSDHAGITEPARRLRQEFPDLVDGYTQLYARKYAPSNYRKEVSGLIGMLKQKYGLAGRRLGRFRRGLSGSWPDRD